VGIVIVSVSSHTFSQHILCVFDVQTHSESDRRQSSSTFIV